VNDKHLGSRKEKFWKTHALRCIAAVSWLMTSAGAAWFGRDFLEEISSSRLKVFKPQFKHEMFFLALWFSKRSRLQQTSYFV
jgi:hypothetical protein